MLEVKLQLWNPGEAAMFAQFLGFLEQSRHPQPANEVQVVPVQQGLEVQQDVEVQQPVASQMFDISDTSVTRALRAFADAKGIAAATQLVQSLGASRVTGLDDDARLKFLVQVKAALS